MKSTAISIWIASLMIVAVFSQSVLLAKEWRAPNSVGAYAGVLICEGAFKEIHPLAKKKEKAGAFYRDILGRAEKAANKSDVKLALEILLSVQKSLEEAKDNVVIKCYPSSDYTLPKFAIGIAISWAAKDKDEWVEALKWLKLAAEENATAAIKMIPLVEDQLSASQIAEAEKLAREWFFDPNRVPIVEQSKKPTKVPASEPRQFR